MIYCTSTNFLCFIILFFFSSSAAGSVCVAQTVSEDSSLRNWPLLTGFTG